MKQFLRAQPLNPVVFSFPPADLFETMAVNFVPPRTLIRQAAPSTIESTNQFKIEGDEDDLYGDVEMTGMDEHGGGSLLTRKLVVPGQLVTDDPQFMRYADLYHFLISGDMERMSVKKIKS
jgi:hypothetical protein